MGVQVSPLVLFLLESEPLMKQLMRFYGYFAAAYGTFWLLLFGLAIITQSHIDAGWFGIVGFPLIALIYAGIRMTTHQGSAARDSRPEQAEE